MKKKKQNIVLITADSLRADHCGFLGGDAGLTPNLDRMARDSINYRNAVAPGPRTPSSMPEIFTGSFLPGNDFNPADGESRVGRIADHMARSEPLPESLREQGYSTNAFTANPWTIQKTNFSRGFDTFYELGEVNLPPVFDYLPNNTLKSFSKYAYAWWSKDIWFSQWPTFYEEVREAARELDEPYFLWVFLMDTHNPYVVPRQYRAESSAFGMYSTLARTNDLFAGAGGGSSYKGGISEKLQSDLLKLYRDSVRSVDAFVGKLREEIDSENTTFVFHSDHGEAFGEHGTYGHQRRLYEENIHVPLLIDHGQCSDDIDQPFSLRDLPNIVTNLESLPDAISSWTTKRTVSRTEDGEKIAVRSQSWKCIFSDGDVELYDLSADPAESTDVSDNYEGVVDEFRDVASTELEQVPQRSDSDVSIDDDNIEEKLKALGYLE